MAPRTHASRYLWLLRHAKTVTDPPPGGSDFDRVLAPRDKKALSLADRRGFPTCALGVYAFSGHHWADVDFEAAKLVALLTPPY